MKRRISTLRLLPALLLIIISSKGFSQCPEISSTTMTPAGCTSGCTLCEGDNITLTATGFNLPNGGKIDWYIDPTPGFDPYSGEGTLLGSSNVTTPMTPCSPPPSFIGMMIDACGPEAANEFMVFDAGGGFDVNDLLVDFDMHNNGGSGNDDLGNGFPCGFQPGNPNLVSGCSDVFSIGPGDHVPAGGILVLFTSSGGSTTYDMSGICPDCRKVYVLQSNCARTKGAFSNHTSSGTRTTNWSIACGGGGSIIYDCADLSGDGDQYVNGGVSNGTCDFEGSAGPFQIPSTITTFSTTVPHDWCDNDYEIVGVVNPWAGSDCCSDPYTDRFSIHVSCPVAKPANIEACDKGDGTGDFDLSQAESTVNDGSGYTVEWYRDAALQNPVFSPYNSRSGKIYAVVRDGNCVSPAIEVTLTVLPLPTIKGNLQIEACESPSGSGTITLNMDSLGNILTLGDASLELHYWEDAAHTIEIADDPYNTSQGSFYYTASDGRCTAKGMIIVIVNPTPQAFDISIDVCENPPGSGQATVDLNSYRDKITVGNVTEVHFYTDKDPNTSVSSPYKTGSTTLYARVEASPCNSDWVEVNIHVLGAIDPKDAVVRLCATSSDSTATFTLMDVYEQVNHGRAFKLFADDMGNTPATFPYTGRDTIFYGQLDNDSCTSGLFKVTLDVASRPDLPAVTAAQICSDSLGHATFDLESVKQTIANGDTTLAILLSSDSLLRDTIKGTQLTLTRDSSFYAVAFNGGCYSDTVRVDFHIVSTPFIDKIADIEGCDSVMLPSITGMRLSGNEAYYSQSGGAGMKWLAGQIFKTSGHLYVYDKNRFCNFEREFNITVHPSVHAGEDIQRSVCQGTVFSLTDLLNGADSGGVFKDVNGNGALTGDTIHTGMLPEGSYTYRYVRYSGTTCPDDSATITITVVREVYAGDDITADTICDVDSVALTSLINGDQGGRVVVLPSMLPAAQNGYLTGKELGLGPHRLAYIVGDGVTCPRDTAFIEIVVQPTVTINAPIDIKTCDFYILPPISHIGGNPMYFTETNGMGQVYSPGDTVFLSQDLYITDPQSTCSDEVSLHIEIGTISYNNITGTLCPGTEITVNGKAYNQAHPSGTETLTGANAQGCDSIIRIDLSFYAPSESYIDTTLCPGEAIVVNGVTYDASNPSGQETLTAASANQCDSTVHIRLSYFKTDTTITGQFCNDEMVTIGGMSFDAHHASGTLLLTGAARGGCDSTIRVRLQFVQAVEAQYSDQICDGDTLFVNGHPYYSGHLTGSDTFPKQSAKGCDSILHVTFALLQPGRGEVSSTLCPEESLTVNGTVYNRSNPQGRELLPGMAANGCDSIIEVQLDFYDYFVQSDNSKYEIVEGDSVRPIITTDMDYVSAQWSPSTGLSCTDCLEPTIRPATSTTYTLSLTDSNGCVVQLSIEVLVTPKPTGGIFIPNTFSPNGDGQNEKFRIFTSSEGGTVRVFGIFDRWGEQVYLETNTQAGDPTSHTGWDGKSHGKEMLPGVYLYRVVFEKPDGTIITRTGDLTLLR